MDEIHFLYIFSDGDGKIKIGRSSDPLMRAEQLPNEIQLDESYCIPSLKDDVNRVERELHRVFNEKNIKHKERFDGHTEWFCSSILDDVFYYLDDKYGVKSSEWITLSSFDLRNALKEYREENTVTKTQSNFCVMFKKEYSDLYNSGVFGVEFNGDKTKKSPFIHKSFKDLWLWFYTRENSKFFNISYNSDGKIITETLNRDHIDAIRHEFEKKEELK